MRPESIEALDRAITGLRRRYAALMRQSPEVREVSARWAAEATGLCWFVPLEDVVESDIDVEFAPEVLIVRASLTWPESAVLTCILPAPPEFDLTQTTVQFTEETLVIRIRRARGGTTR